MSDTPPPSVVTRPPGSRPSRRANPFATPDSSPNPNPDPDPGPAATVDGLPPATSTAELLDRSHRLGEDGGDAGATEATKPTDGRSSPASTEPPRSEREITSISRALVPVVVKFVQALSLAVHQVRCGRTPTPNAVWVASEDEAKAIAAPLARIAVRHMPAGIGEVNGDVADVMEAGLAAFAYVSAHAPADALVHAGIDPATGQPYQTTVPEGAAA